MTVRFRVIDTGLRDGRMQIAFDQAMIDLHRNDEIPDTIRFLRFEASALVGRHQAIGQELRLDYCRTNGVRLVRRITGGGAIYLDPGQLGWELLISRKRLPMAKLQDYTGAICEAVASGLSKAFAVDARFRPRNDIEVDGQKLCGTGGFFDGDTLFYQGTVLIDADPERVMACLNVPQAKLKKKGIDNARQRVTTLKALLAGTAPDVHEVQRAVLAGLSGKLGISYFADTPTAKEEELAKKLYADEIGNDEFVFSIDDPRCAGIYESELTGPGGTISAYVRLEGGASGARIREVLLTGDFFVTPPRTILDLEANLRGIPVEAVGSEVERFFERAKPDLLTVAPSDFKRVIQSAIEMAEP
jgi:lipoate-protein ligase A